MTTSTPGNETPGARASFLLEIGSEEIPARFMVQAIGQLESRMRALLDEKGLAHSGMKVYATPRRLALICDELQIRQEDRTIDVKGPPVKVAFDKDGNPTPAATGFARKNGLSLEECHRVEDGRGEYLAARRTEKGEDAAAVLARRLPELVLGMPFPKVMRWGDGDIEYPRPLQWLLTLLGDDVIPVRIASLESGRISRGHRTLSNNAEIEISRPEDYLTALEAAGVVADHRLRRKAIESQADAVLSGRDGAQLIQDEKLLTEVVFLTEHPTAFLGSFESEFFELPPEVIVTALKEHQRYFAVSTPEGKDLLPCFVAVRDGGEDFIDNVRAGNERVLRARLSDALFYWQFDQRRTPDEHVARLADVTWIEGLGSMLDKTVRIRGLVGWLWEHGFGDGGEVPQTALRAAEICKSDQVTEMIRDGKEFTSLEGLIGSRYAAEAGEEAEVCLAIENHYLPRSAGGALPADAVSRVLSAADRLDTLAGCWLAGFAPTGAKDPYALRRHTLALLRMMIDGGLRVSVSAMIARALDGFSGTGLAADEEAAESIRVFVQRRLSGLLVEAYGCVAEAVRAGMPAHGDDPTTALAWAKTLADFRDEDNFKLLATGFKRCKNILEGNVLAGADLAGCRDRWLAGGVGAGNEDFDMLTEAAELRLRQEVAATVGRLQQAESAGDLPTVCRLLSDLGPAIDEFFDSVRVNVSDDAVKNLRHAFLREIQAIFAGYADFSEIAPLES